MEASAVNKSGSFFPIRKKMESKYIVYELKEVTRSLLYQNKVLPDLTRSELR